MRRPFQSTVRAGTLVSLAALTAAACAQSFVEFPPISDNAALQYWQAFATMPALDAEQEKLLDNRAVVPLDDAAIKLLDQSQTSVLFLHRGAQLRNCDWGLDYRDGARMYLPHLAKARMLARLAALDARRALEAKDYDRAGDDVYGMTTLARHVGKDYTLVSMLVSYAIEGMAVDAVAPYLPETRPSYQDALANFESLPSRSPLSQAVLCEKQMAYTIVGQLQEADHRRPGSWRQVWKEMWKETLGELGDDPFQDVESLGQLVEDVEEFQTLYDELAELMALPPDDFDARYPEFAKRAQAANPVAKICLPAMEKTVAAQRRCEVRTAMGLAAIAVVESGPETLTGIKDPFGDGPFAYRKLDTGFQLSSKLLEDGKPVTLEIGQKPAAPSQ